MEPRLLEPILKTAAKTGRISFGVKETLKAIKGAKVIILSSSLTSHERKAIVDAAKSANVPIVTFDETSIRLGNISGKAFPIKSLAIRSAGDADIERLLKMAGAT
ncbi:MAG: ribosomal L7Ae/L30e/S12e/Gadd45 family protein [Conexivisphaerales archaeon]